MYHSEFNLSSAGIVPSFSEVAPSPTRHNGAAAVVSATDRPRSPLFRFLMSTSHVMALIFSGLAAVGVGCDSDTDWEGVFSGKMVRC